MFRIIGIVCPNLRILLKIYFSRKHYKFEFYIKIVYELLLFFFNFKESPAV